MVKESGEFNDYDDGNLSFRILNEELLNQLCLLQDAVYSPLLIDCLSAKPDFRKGIHISLFEPDLSTEPKKHDATVEKREIYCRKLFETIKADKEYQEHKLEPVVLKGSDIVT